MALRIVSCTRGSREDFAATLLGRSLAMLKGRVELSLLGDNGGTSAAGLGAVYNAAIDAADADDVLVFVHDDVAIADWLLPERLGEAFRHFDLVGVVGNAEPDWRQPSWGLAFDAQLRKTGWQPREHHSGQVAHQVRGRLVQSRYGPWPRPVKLLDGLFLAARAATLRARGLRFDPRFRFHCYDVDFCRQSVAAGLRPGTWPIALVHGSGGNFGSEDFRAAARLYLEKWGGGPDDSAEQ